MQKSAFLYEVRQRIANKSPEALKKSILELARGIPRSEYEEMLALLGKDEEPVLRKNGTDLLTSVRQLCESVENGGYDLSWEFDDGYGYDGYWDDETLIDRDGLGEQMEALFKDSITYVEDKRYSEALLAFDELFAVEVPLDDYDDIDIMTLFGNDVINLEALDVLHYYAYAAMMVLRDNERVQKLFDITSLASYKIKLQDIAQIGDDEIPEREKFAKQWIKFLKEHLHPHYEGLLIDAVIYSGGTAALREFAKEHGVQYQTAYIELITIYMTEKQYEDAITVALEGLAKLDIINNRRASVANLLLEAGKIKNDEKLIKTAIWEGFRSSLNLRHFINLLRLNDGGMVNETIQYLDDNYKNNNGDYNYIHFLNGDYDLVWDDCKKDKKFLGWSSSEKGKILPLFVALLSGGQALLHCTKNMIKNSFTNESIFEDFIQILAESLKSLSDEDYQKYYDWCVQETAGRVDGIVSGQHRGSYFKASALVVSIAEVIRARDGGFAAAAFIKSYKEKYPRHTAFHGCLREDIALGKFGKII